MHVLAYHYIQGLPWQIENENKYFVKMGNKFEVISSNKNKNNRLSDPAGGYPQQFYKLFLKVENKRRNQNYFQI